MKRRYHHVETWECLGMYQAGNEPSDHEATLQQYAAFLRDDIRFRRSLDRVLAEWPISCEQFLLNESINRIAWLGQAAMCMDTGIPRKYRAGFMRLSDRERRCANATAHEYLTRWLRRYATENSAISEDVAQAGLFDRHS